MKIKKTLIIKIAIASIYLCVLISITSLILQESGIKLLYRNETSKLDILQISSDKNMFLTEIFKFSDFYSLIKIKTEETLRDKFGCDLGKFVYLCLNSWVIGAIFSYFAVKKIHYHRIMKMGIY
jgi:hypothetical protein